MACYAWPAHSPTEYYQHALCGYVLLQDDLEDNTLPLIQRSPFEGGGSTIGAASHPLSGPVLGWRSAARAPGTSALPRLPLKIKDSMEFCGFAGMGATHAGLPAAAATAPMPECVGNGCLPAAPAAEASASGGAPAGSDAGIELGTAPQQASAQVPQLPALRQEDLIYRRNAFGQKIMLGKGGYGAVRPLSVTASVCWGGLRLQFYAGRREFDLTRLCTSADGETCLSCGI